MGESGKWDSNPRPSAWKAETLPLSYSRKNSEDKRSRLLVAQRSFYKKEGTPNNASLQNFVSVAGDSPTSGTSNRLDILLTEVRPVGFEPTFLPT